MIRVSESDGVLLLSCGCTAAFMLARALAASGICNHFPTYAHTKHRVDVDIVLRVALRGTLAVWYCLTIPGERWSESIHSSWRISVRTCGSQAHDYYYAGDAYTGGWYSAIDAPLAS
jgi:hypothetical protein